MEHLPEWENDGVSAPFLEQKGQLQETKRQETVNEDSIQYHKLFEVVRKYGVDAVRDVLTATGSDPKKILPKLKAYTDSLGMDLTKENN